MKKNKLKPRRNNTLALVAAGFGFFAYIFAFTLAILFAVYNDLHLDALFQSGDIRIVTLSVIAGFFLSVIWGIVAFKVPPHYYRFGGFLLNALLLGISVFYLVRLIRHFQNSFTIDTADTLGTIIYLFLFLTAGFLIVMIILAVFDLIFCFPRGKADKEATIYEQQMAKERAREKKDYLKIQTEKDAEKMRIRDENEKSQLLLNDDINVIKLDSGVQQEIIINYNFDYTTAPFPRPLTAKEQIQALYHLQELYYAGLLNEREVAAYKKRIIARDIKAESKE
ncbi:MAG: hypothetical protein ACOX3K_02360 [Bacilli bacterium]|jgi:hypothetical protein